MSLLNLHRFITEEPRRVASSQDEAGWSALIAGIRRGDPDAVSDFGRAYSNGIRLYLKRRQGVDGLEVLVRKILAGVVEQIREGRIEQPADLLLTLRRMVAPRRAASTADNADGAVEAKARILARELRYYSKRDREMLIRYYVRRQDVPQILKDMGVTEAEFLLARARLKAATTSAGTRKPDADGAAKLCQKAAAGR